MKSDYLLFIIFYLLFSISENSMSPVPSNDK